MALAVTKGRKLCSRLSTDEHTAALRGCIDMAGEGVGRDSETCVSEHDGRLYCGSPFGGTRCGEDVAAGAPTELGTASDKAGDS